MNDPIPPPPSPAAVHPLMTSISRPFAVSILALAGFLYGYLTLNNAVIHYDGFKTNVIVDGVEGDHYRFRVENKKDSLLLTSREHPHAALVHVNIPRRDFTFVSNPPLLIWIILMSMMLSTALGLFLPLFRCLTDLVFEFRPGALARWSLGMMIGTFALILIPHLNTINIFSVMNVPNILTAFEMCDLFDIVLTDMSRARVIVYSTLTFAGFTIAVMYVGNSCIPNIETPVAHLDAELGKLTDDNLTSIDKENMNLMRILQNIRSMKKRKYLIPFLTIYKLFNARKIYQVLHERMPATGKPSVAQIARRYETIDSSLRFLLLSLALLIIYSILTSATFQQVFARAMYLNGGKNTLYPSEFVYAYGLGFTILLAIIYLPIDFHLRDHGKRLALNARTEAGNDPQRLKDMEKDLLMLEGKGSGFKNFSSFLAILSPVLGSAFTEFVKNISG